MKRKLHVQNMLLVAGSLVITAIFAEIILRTLLPAPIVWRFPQEAYEFDPEIGHRLKPNQQAYTHDKTVIINSQGIRDAEYSTETPSGVTRILALGDSQTFGNGVENRYTWPKQLEYELQKQAGVNDYEVLNGGLPASDTWQHEILLQRLLLTYKPDIVVLAFYVNDIVSKPATVRNPQGDDAHMIDRRLVYMLKHSALLLSLRTAYSALMHTFAPRRDFLLQNALLAGESGPTIDKRWDQVERSLLKMKEVTAGNRVDFLVISLPRRDQVYNHIGAEKYNERLSAVMKSTGVKFMNMLYPLQQAYREHGKLLFIPWDGHNTAIANRIIAGQVASAIPGLMAGELEQSGPQANNR